MNMVFLSAYLKAIVNHQFLAVNQNKIEKTRKYPLFASLNHQLILVNR
jgi:hypothetical protein